MIVLSPGFRMTRFQTNSTKLRWNKSAWPQQRHSFQWKHLSTSLWQCSQCECAGSLLRCDYPQRLLAANPRLEVTGVVQPHSKLWGSAQSWQRNRKYVGNGQSLGGLQEESWGPQQWKPTPGMNNMLSAKGRDHFPSECRKANTGVVIGLFFLNVWTIFSKVAQT